MFSEIIVGYDGSERSEDALVLAGKLARIGHGSVIAVYVYGYRRSTRISTRTGEFAATLADAERTLGLLRDRLDDEIDARPVRGFSAHRGLQELAEDEDADLIVVGSTAQGRWGRTLPGTSAERLVKVAPCPVAVVPLGYRGQAADTLHRIGIAYNAGEEAAAALQASHAIARAADATLTVISAFDPSALPSGDDAAKAREDAKRDFDMALEHLTDGVPVHGELIDGPAVAVLREHTGDLDLLVMGSRAHGPIRRAVLGSVSRGVLLDSRCPVLVLARGAPPLTEATRAASRIRCAEPHGNQVRVG